jgi:methyl-accepting chemotaxis protein
MKRPSFRLKFIHKILLATSALVIASFAIFTAYIYRDQQISTGAALTGQLKSVGSTTATSIANWLNGRVLMVETLGQTLANDASQPVVDHTVAQAGFKSNFMFTYLGTAAAAGVLGSAEDLASQSDRLRNELERFVAALRAA